MSNPPTRPTLYNLVNADGELSYRARDLVQDFSVPIPHELPDPVSSQLLPILV